MKLPAAPYWSAMTADGLSGWLRMLVTSVAAGWGVEHQADGRHSWHWTDLAYSDLHFSASGSMTWTVASGDVLQARWGRLGDWRVFSVRIANATVGGTVSTNLQIDLPNNEVGAAWATGGCGYTTDNGTAVNGVWEVQPDSRVLSVIKHDVSNWTAGDGFVTLTATYQVQ